MVKTLFPMQGVQVSSLVREPCMLQLRLGTVKGKKKKKKKALCLFNGRDKMGMILEKITQRSIASLRYTDLESPQKVLMV